MSAQLDVTYQDVYDTFVKKLYHRQQITDKHNPLLQAQLRPVIQNYIDYNKIIDPEDQKLLYSHRYYIYINHFIRFMYDITPDGENYYNLEYILDESTNKLNIYNTKILNIIETIFINRKRSFDLTQPKHYNITSHGEPINSQFTVPDNLTICYLTPITYSLGNQHEFYMNIFKQCYSSASPNTLELVLRNNNIGCHFEFFYPGQKIWDLRLLNSVEPEIGYYNISKKIVKLLESKDLFSKSNTIMLSDFIKDKKGILFITACRVCGLSSKLNSYSIETICIYETLLGILNFIISESLNNKELNSSLYNKESKDIFEDIYRKKNENRKIFDFPEIAEGHIPFYDPLLSINYNDPKYIKRRNFFTAHSNLASSNKVRKANNKKIIDTYLSNTDTKTLFGELNRNHILNAILNAISFKNNSNIIEELCMHLIHNKPELTFKTFKEQNKTIIDYLVDSKEYFRYGMLLYLYQLTLEKPKNFNDRQSVLSYLTKHIINLPVLQELVDNLKDMTKSSEFYKTIVHIFADQATWYIVPSENTKRNTYLIENLVNFLCIIITSIPDIEKQTKSVINYLVRSKDFFMYGMLLYLYQLGSQNPEDFEDKESSVLVYLSEHIINLPVLQELVNNLKNMTKSSEFYTTIVDIFVKQSIWYIDASSDTEERTYLIANLINFLCIIITSIPDIDKSYLNSTKLVVNDKVITTGSEIHSFLKSKNLNNDIGRSILTKITFCMPTRAKITSRKTKKLSKYRKTQSENFTSLRKNYYNYSLGSI